MTETVRKKLAVGLFIISGICLAAGLYLGRNLYMPSGSSYTVPIINVHEHIQSTSQADTLLAAMDSLGIEKTVLFGSSWFTITLNPAVGFTRYDWNNEELLKVVEQHPGRFEAWPTINPTDPDKLDKFKSLVERGATGLKLYLGHGYKNPRTGEYLFHEVAMDDPGMLPVYEYCEKNFLPICFHVNPGPLTPGFAEEFIAVLDAFPDLKINCPHFMLSSIRDSRLREFLDTYPNLYTDVSFGHDDFLIAGLKRISRSPTKFRRIFADYPDRFMFGTDLVITAAPSKNAQWISVRIKAYIDMRTKHTYTTPLIPGEQMRGLALPRSILNKVFRENYIHFMAKRPVGTKITRHVDWSKMGIEPTGRKPGVASKPPSD
ncbi:MAG: amidohydrolase family protein [Candidatus Hydrogenedentes bacterium]|nr:amidohydrolase family protein [Candidatus Hydrogenedentota bacterium]